MAGRDARDERAAVDALLTQHGTTFAQAAGIRLRDRPSPLYRLLVLATLLSARITAEVATAAARELFRGGCRTPRAMLDAGWQQRVDLLGRGHYKRYDESTATMLGDGAQLCLDRWKGDLRRLRDEAGGERSRIEALLTEFPGIGPTGAQIFVREVQDVWPTVGVVMDERVLEGARDAGLPADAETLGRLAGPGGRAALAAALVRVSLQNRRRRADGTQRTTDPVNRPAR